MTLQEFINKYKGKKVDWDGAYGAQCMDLYRYYVKEVWNKPQTPGVIGAYQVFNTISDKVYNKFTSGVIEPGDVITWNEKQVKNGHIAIVTKSDSQGFECFQQNAPKTGDSCNLARYTYKNIIGWFRPKTMTTLKVKLVMNDANWSSLTTKLNDIAQRTLTASNGQLKFDVAVEEVSFANIPFVNAPNGAGFQIIDEAWYDANITPLALDYDVVIFQVNRTQWLVTNSATGYRTDHDQGPVEIQIGSDENESISSPNWTMPLFVNNFLHEITHALFVYNGGVDYTHDYIANSQGKFELKEAWAKLNYDIINLALMKKNNMEIINDNGTYFLVGEKGKIGLEDAKSLETFRKITAKERTASTTNLPKVGVFGSGISFDAD